jgi:hypothetical protein
LPRSAGGSAIGAERFGEREPATARAVGRAAVRPVQQWGTPVGMEPSLTCGRDGRRSRAELPDGDVSAQAPQVQVAGDLAEESAEVERPDEQFPRVDGRATGFVPVHAEGERRGVRANSRCMRSVAGLKSTPGIKSVTPDSVHLGETGSIFPAAGGNNPGHRDRLPHRWNKE